MATSALNSDSSSGLSLAIRLRDGSLDAWAELVDLYGPLIESWTTAAGLGAMAREDIAQEVFLSVHRSIGNFDPDSPGSTFRGWLWRITRNAILQSLRKPHTPGRGGSAAAQRLGQFEDPLRDASLAERFPDATADRPPARADDTTDLLHRAMQQVKPKVEPTTWDAFWETTVRGRSAIDVAESLGISPAAVRKAKSRTLQRLRKQIGDRV